MQPRRRADGLSRRELVIRGAALGALALAAPSALGCGGSEGPRIVIVGAGLAGLSCANRLARAGLSSSVYEANPDRIGGRCWTAREFENGQIAEHGGELIDSRHARIRALAGELGLELVDLFDLPDTGTSRWWLRGERRRAVRRLPGWEQLYEVLTRAASEIGPYSYDDATPAARALDEISAGEFIEDSLPGGIDSVAGRAASALLATDLGLDPGRLSAINLITQFVEPAPGADERFTIAGGNDQLVDGLAGSLPDGTVVPGAPLQSLRRRGEGSYALEFGDVTGEVIADYVVLALPFTTLREVDLSRSGFSARRLACIDELGMGTNAKVLMQFDRRPEAYGRWDGDLTSDSPMLQTWESTAHQKGASSIITTFLGGRSGVAGLAAPEAHAASTPRGANRNLDHLTERGGTGITGLRGGFNGRSWTDRWVGDPWARGSYAAYEPGQFTRYYGFVGLPERDVYFAGEHTRSTEAQGYLEGAVASGQDAADAIARRAR